MEHPPLSPAEKARFEAMDAKSFDLIQMKMLVDIGANIVLVLAAFMLLAVTLTFPFPYVRKAWLGEIWGYYGLLNSLFFILIARSIKNLSLAAVFGGIGIVIFEQILTWRSFWYLHVTKGVDFSSLVFVVLSILVTGILLAVFFYSMYAIFVYRRFKQEFNLGSRKRKKNDQQFPVGLTRVLVFSTYFLCLYLLSKTNRTDVLSSFGHLRLIGGLISMTAPLGAGAELDACLKKGKLALLPSAFIVLNVIAWIVFLGLTLFMIPLESVLIKSAAIPTY